MRSPSLMRRRTAGLARLALLARDDKSFKADTAAAPDWAPVRLTAVNEDDAVDLTGLGADAVRWIPVDAQLRMDVAALTKAIDADTAAGETPFLVVGTAGTVSTGAVDPLRDIAALCKARGLWFHVDGAYGGFAAALPDASADLRGLALADSVAIDPHKWLFAPFDCAALVYRDPALARAVAAKPKPPAVSLAVICRDGPRMQQLARALEFFAPDLGVMQFPAWDCQPYDRVSPHGGILAQRLTTLARLSRLTGSEKPLIVLTTVNAIVQRVPAREQVAAHVRRMLDDPKFDKPRLLGFFREYFDYGNATEVFKDKPKDFIHDPRQLVADTDRLVLHILAEDKDVLRQLLTTPQSFVNFTTAKNKQTRMEEPKRAVVPPPPGKKQTKSLDGLETLYGVGYRYSDIMLSGSDVSAHAILAGVRYKF